MKIIGKKNICSNPDSVFCYFGWPSITRLPGGVLAMAASGFRMRHVCPFGKAVISYSPDEGESWTLPAPVIDTILDDRDSGIVPFGNGRVIFTSFNNTIEQQRKWAQGLPTSTPAEKANAALTFAYLDAAEATGLESKYLGSTYKISDDGGMSFGKLHISPVTAPHGPMATNDGGLLYIGRRFSGDDSFDAGDKPYVECWRLNADDEFEYVSAIENIDNGNGGVFNSCEPHAIMLPDGKIIVHIRVQNDCFTVYQSESTDGGRTFTKPHILLDRFGGSPAHLLLHSSGKLISVYGYRNAPYGIRYMVSDDEGASWQTNLVLDDQGPSSDLGYPATVELKDGTLYTVYYENTDGVSVIRGIHWSL